MKIVVGITGGIAAYKACEVVSVLTKSGIDVHVIMTKNATEFVTPLTFESLTGNVVTVGMFDEGRDRGIKHVSLAKSCDLAIIVPCTANMVGKIAAGIADDFLSTFVMACKSPVIISPAMNTNMYESIAYQENSAILQRRGYLFIQPSTGRLACGDEGKGRLASIDRILFTLLYELRARHGDQPQIRKLHDIIMTNYSATKNVGNEGAEATESIAYNVVASHVESVEGENEFMQTTTDTELREKLECGDFVGKNVVITAGGTVSPLDAVRCISNHSSGRMGIEIARAAKERGAEVTLIRGKTSVVVDFECKIVDVSTTREMHTAVLEALGEADYIIKAAAPADYELVSLREMVSASRRIACDDASVAEDINISASSISASRMTQEKKLKGDKLFLTLRKGVDIAADIGRRKGDKKLVIFAAETENLIRNATGKLVKKNADMVVANDISKEGAGFNSDTNIATIIFKNGKQLPLKKMLKSELANIILDNLLLIKNEES